MINRGIPYIYKNKVYLGKNLKQVLVQFQKYSAFARKRSRRNWTLIMWKKYKRKINRKNKSKYKRKIHERGVFGDAFRTLRSFGKLWYKSLCGKWDEKKNYVLVKLNVSKRVTLPNGRTFIARYKRMKRSELLSNIVMKRTYTQRAVQRGRRRKRKQQGQGIFDFVKKVARNPLVKSIAKKGLGVYHNLTKRVKNKTLKRILKLHTAHLALNKAIKATNNRLSNG